MKASRLKSLLNRLPGPDKRFTWLCLLIIVKFTFLFFIVSQHRPTTLPETIAVCSGDCDSYLTPVDHLIEYGSYVPDYRMPGYGLPYFVFRLFFEKNTATDLLIIFQTLMDAIAALILALTLYLMTEKKYCFHLTLIFYGAAVTISCYNNWILTESLTASVLVFGFCFLVRHFKSKKNYNVILSGLFFTWAYFLRPVNFPLLLIPAVIIFFYDKNSSFKNSFLFILPAIVFQSLWTIRGCVMKNKFILLTEHNYLPMYSQPTIESWNFCKTFSDSKYTASFFDPQGLTYFGQPVQLIKIDDIKIPDEIYTEDFNLDSLLLLRKNFEEIYSASINPERKLFLENLIISKFKFYTQSVRRHHPFIVYVKTPIMLTINFVIQSGVHNLFFQPFSNLGMSQKIIKLFFIAVYWTVFIFFLFGLVAYSGHIINNKLVLACFLIAFYVIFIHSVFLRFIEQRYLIPAYPFFVTGAVYSLHLLINRLSIKKSVDD